jgi:hypothetical protein
MFLEHKAQSDIRETNFGKENYKDYCVGKVFYFCRSEIIYVLKFLCVQHTNILEHKNVFKLYSVTFTITKHSIHSVPNIGVKI